MNTDEHGSAEDEYRCEELTGKVIGVFYDVYNELGFGFLESVYKAALVIALRDAGLDAEAQYPVPVWFRGRQISRFEADVLVEGSVLLELKAIRTLDKTHESQLLNYLRATPIEVGLLLNFGPTPQIKRLMFDNARKRPPGAK